MKIRTRNLISFGLYSILLIVSITLLVKLIAIPSQFVIKDNDLNMHFYMNVDNGTVDFEEFTCYPLTIEEYRSMTGGQSTCYRSDPSPHWVFDCDSDRPLLNCMGRIV